MAAIRYTRSPLSADLRRAIAEELRRVQVTTDSIVELLQALNVPVELGANDSGGTGYRVLRVPNA